MTPRFLACSKYCLLGFCEFRSIERMRFGENRTPLYSTVPDKCVQDKRHRFSLRKVRFEVSLRHPNDISRGRSTQRREEVRTGDTWGVVKTLGLDKTAKGDRVEQEENHDLSLKEGQLYQRWKENFLQQRPRNDQRNPRKTKNMGKHRSKGGECFRVEEGIVNSVKCH